MKIFFHILQENVIRYEKKYYPFINVFTERLSKQLKI